MTEVAPPSTIADPEPEVVDTPIEDPFIQVANTIWMEFKSADYEGRITLFRKTMNEDGVMDHEMAFDMLDQLFTQTIEHDERRRFDALIEELRVRLPDVYQRESSYFLNWLLTNALAEGRLDAIRPLVREHAETAGRDIDTFNWTLDRLCYHGRLAELVEATAIAFPLVKESDDILPWGISEFAQRSADYLVFAHLEKHGSIDPDDPALLKEIRNYIDPDLDRFRRFCNHLSGVANIRWTMNDFDLRKKNSKGGTASGRDNLYFLIIDFIGYLHHEEGIPFTKGKLGCDQILDYIINRHDGELAPRESMFDAVMFASKPKHRQSGNARPVHELCPDRDTFDRHLAGLMDFVNPQYYKVAASIEIIPAWLSFLEARQLIDERRRKTVIDNLRPVADSLRELWGKRTHREDPALLHGIEVWPKNPVVK